MIIVGIHVWYISSFLIPWLGLCWFIASRYWLLKIRHRIDIYIRSWRSLICTFRELITVVRWWSLGILTSFKSILLVRFRIHVVSTHFYLSDFISWEYLRNGDWWLFSSCNFWYLQFYFRFFKWWFVHEKVPTYHCVAWSALFRPKLW